MLDMSSLLKGDVEKHSNLQKVFSNSLIWSFGRKMRDFVCFVRQFYVVYAASCRLLHSWVVFKKLENGQVLCTLGIPLLPFLKFLSVAMTHIVLSRHQESWTQCEKLWSRRYFNGQSGPHRYQCILTYFYTPNKWGVYWEQKNLKLEYIYYPIWISASEIAT